MTTIAYDGSLIACDSLSLASGTIDQQASKKIYATNMSHEFEWAFGAGSLSTVRKFVDWCDNPSMDFPKQQDADTFTTLGAIATSGELIVFEDATEVFRTTLPYAMGSGREFAMGAMLAGKAANDAVRIAIELDPFSGGPIISYGVTVDEMEASTDSQTTSQTTSLLTPPSQGETLR